MARRDKEKLPERISGGFSAIPWSVLDSISFMGASDKAKALLFALMRQHNGKNNGHLHLAKQWLYNHGWTCDENNRKARRELIDRGLLVQTKQGGLNMGADLFAVTWHDINNFVGLDIESNHYARGAYSLCKLEPTARRKPPIKKICQPNSRDSASTTTGPAKSLTGTTTELVNATFNDLTGTTTENNVLIPIHILNSKKRIVGVKGKSGIAKQL